MKRNIALPLILLTVITFACAISATGQIAYLHLNNAPGTNFKTFTTANKNALSEIKNTFIADSAKIVREDSTTFTAELPDSKWTWEKKDGTPVNNKAIVVINKKYDIGANKVRKPESVITFWVVSLADDKKSYTIELINVLSIYQKNRKNNTGYSTGLYEEKIAGLVK